MKKILCTFIMVLMLMQINNIFCGSKEAIEQQLEVLETQLVLAEQEVEYAQMGDDLAAEKNAEKRAEEIRKEIDILNQQLEKFQKQ